MEDTKEVRYALPMDLLEMVVGYLGERKYLEVRHIIARIEQETIKIDIPIEDAQ